MEIIKPSPTTTDAVITCDNNSNKEKVPLVQEEETPSSAAVVVATKIPDESAAVDTSTTNSSSNSNNYVLRRSISSRTKTHTHLVCMGHSGLSVMAYPVAKYDGRTDAYYFKEEPQNRITLQWWLKDSYLANPN